MCPQSNAFLAVFEQGLKALEFVSLDADMAVASTPCHYLEDEKAHIPHFQQVWIHLLIYTLFVNKKYINMIYI
jgi:hypothetical protein